MAMVMASVIEVIEIIEIIEVIEAVDLSHSNVRFLNAPVVKADNS
jgi:hypothetical protein